MLTTVGSSSQAHERTFPTTAGPSPKYLIPESVHGKKEILERFKTEILLYYCGVFFMMMMEAAPSCFLRQKCWYERRINGHSEVYGFAVSAHRHEFDGVSASDCAPDEGCAQHSAFFSTGGVRGGEACCDEEYSASSVREPCIVGPSRAPAMSRAFFRAGVVARMSFSSFNTTREECR